MSNKRLSFIDGMKAFGILFIFIFHVYRNSFIKGWFGIFQITLFLAASGILFEELSFERKDIKKFIKRRTYSLIVPYLIWGGITLVYYYIIERRFRNLDLSLSDCIIRGLLLGEEKYLDFNTPLWFIPVFFVSQISFIIIVNMINRFLNKSGENRTACLIITGVFVSWLYFMTTAFLPKITVWSLYDVPRFLFYTWVGVCLQASGIVGRIKKSSKNLIFIFSIIFFVISGLIYILNVHLIVLISLAAIAATLCLSISVSPNKVIDYIGRNTLIVLLVHGPVYRVVTTIIAIITKRSNDMVRSNIWLAALVVVISLAVSLLIGKYESRLLVFSKRYIR